MNRILIPEIQEKVTVNNPTQVNHINNILRSKVGDELKLTVLNQGFSNGVISFSSQDKIIIEQTTKITSCNKPQWFNLIIGASRPPTCKKILEHATTSGAKSFYFFNCELSEKSYLDSRLFTQNEFQKYINNGLSQSSTYFNNPTCSFSKRMEVNKINIPGQKYILSPFASSSFRSQELDFSQPITLAIGPERGWSQQEIDNFKQNGYQEIKISNSILRVENATISAISQLEMLKGLH